jgi:hypothetical protein
VSEKFSARSGEIFFADSVDPADILPAISAETELVMCPFYAPSFEMVKTPIV